MRNNIAVCGSVGAAGNHIRWLILLDERFDFSSIQNVPPLYNAAAASAESELRLLGADIQKKTEYLLSAVYDNNRNIFNWLTYEWRTRNIVNPLIPFKHEYWDCDDPTTQYVYVTPKDSKLALLHYYKFNHKVNHTTIFDFLRELDSFRYAVMNYATKHNSISLDFEDVYSPELDRQLYSSLVVFLGLTDNYDLAARVHSAWYKRCLASVQEFERELKMLLAEIQNPEYRKFAGLDNNENQ